MTRLLLVTRSCVTSVSCVSAGSGGAAGTSLRCGASTRGVVSGGSTEDVSTAGKNTGASVFQLGLEKDRVQLAGGGHFYA